MVPPAEGQELTDIELIEQAQRGDVAAFEELVRRHEQVAFRTALLVCGDAETARDAAQEGFIRAWRALPRFRPGSEPRPWLLRIVANSARNRQRTDRRQAALGLRLALDASSTDPAVSPEASAVAEERRRALLLAIERLRREDRIVIGLRWFVGLDEAELASALGVARGTVKSRLSRAMARLRNELGTDV